MHVGDDLINDCEAAKTHGPARTVLVEQGPAVVPYQPGGGGRTRGIRRERREAWWRGLVDARVTSVGEIPGAIEDIYAKEGENDPTGALTDAESAPLSLASARYGV